MALMDNKANQGAAHGTAPGRLAVKGEQHPQGTEGRSDPGSPGLPAQSDPDGHQLAVCPGPCPAPGDWGARAQGTPQGGGRHATSGPASKRQREDTPRPPRTRPPIPNGTLSLDGTGSGPHGGGTAGPSGRARSGKGRGRLHRGRPPKLGQRARRRQRERRAAAEAADQEARPLPPPPPPPPPAPSAGAWRPESSTQQDRAGLVATFQLQGSTPRDALRHLGLAPDKPAAPHEVSLRTTELLNGCRPWEVSKVLGFLNAEILLLHSDERPPIKEDVPLTRPDCGLTIIRHWLDAKAAAGWKGVLRAAADLRAWSDKSPHTAWLCYCACWYFYGKLGVAPQALDPNLPYLTMGRLVSNLGLPGVTETPHAVNVNLYSADASLPWHADNEPLFDAVSNDASIVSVSFGASRDFRYREWYGDNKYGRPQTITLNAGDVLCMSGRFQGHYQHSVSPGKGGERLNLTFRYIKRHEPYCSRAAEAGQGGAKRRRQ